MEEAISQIMNVPIIPVLLLPVTGLICLVFYNRMGNVNARLRALQKELRHLHVQEANIVTERVQEMSRELYSEIQRLQRRSHRISFSLVCFLLAVFVFSLCGLFVALSLYVAFTLKIALFFWFCGPVFICMGVASGIDELVRAVYFLGVETNLIAKWVQHGEDDSAV